MLFLSVYTLNLTRLVAPAISFNFANCPLCQQVIGHEAVAKDMAPVKDLMADVKARHFSPRLLAPLL